MAISRNMIVQEMIMKCEYNIKKLITDYYKDNHCVSIIQYI